LFGTGQDPVAEPARLPALNGSIAVTLRITLKPGEPVFIGDAVLRVATVNTCVVLIDGDAPVLRAEDFFDSPHPGTPVEAIRLLLQDLYLSRRAEAAFEQFRALAGPLLAQQPGLAPLVEKLEALL